MNIDINVMYRDRADKIMGYKTWSDAKKIDGLLEVNADQYCNLGKTCSKTDWGTARLTSRYIYRLIKTMDVKLGTLLLRDALEHHA